MRAYACARMSAIEVSFAISSSAVPFFHPSLKGRKTTRRFHQNNPSFSSKRPVIFTKTSRCFATEIQTVRQDVRDSSAKIGFGTDVAIILAIIVIHHQ